MNLSADELFGIDMDPISGKMMLEALQLAENMTESGYDTETSNKAFNDLYIGKDHLTGLKKRILTAKKNKRLKLTLGDHLLLYTCYFLFTKFYSDELTSQMLVSTDDMDTMHLDEVEVIQLRFYREEMLRIMNESKQRFASFPLFTKHLETLEIIFPLIKE